MPGRRLSDGAVVRDSSPIVQRALTAALVLAAVALCPSHDSFATYLASIVCTVVAALVLQMPLVTLAAMAVQFCALAWYCASFIPFGRMCIRQCVARTCCPV